MPRPELNNHYWDCECEQNYIHEKSKLLYCHKCGYAQDEAPDSHVDEVTKYFKNLKPNCEETKNA